MRAPEPVLRVAAIVIAIAAVALPPATPGAGAQGRYPRIEMHDAGDLGGEPHKPALAGGIWAQDPLILGVEPDLDRTFLFRLGWLVSDSGPPAVQAADSAGTGGLRGPGTAGDGLRGPAMAADMPSLPTGSSEIAPAMGKPALPPGLPAAPALPEILSFPPLPAGVLDVAVGGTGGHSIVAWAAAEGPAEAPNFRLSARRISQDGSPISPDLTLQVGPGRPADLSVAVAVDGEAIVAWTNHLEGRGAGLRWRGIGQTDALGPLKTDWDIASDQGSPSVVAVPGGFALASLQTTLQGEPPADDQATTERPAADRARTGEAASDADEVVDSRAPLREVRLRRLTPAGGQRGEPVAAAARKGLDHPTAVGRGGALSLFWTDPRGGGRMLRTRSFASDGTASGAEGALRTDLMVSDAAPYRVAPAGEGYWLVAWPQLEGRGRSMVLEARMYHFAGNAAGPPLLLARSPGAIALRDLIPSRGADRWIALWTEEEAGQFRLRYRPIRRDPRG